MELSEVLNISKELGQNDLTKSLEEISVRNQMQNAQLVLPLVGEFSSGKTTLINAVTDSKKLETATKPTTATIYEIFFGSEECHANAIMEDGSVVDYSDIGDLKNEKLSDAAIVTVFDTSKKISPSTVLIDTPGLSSPDPKHKEVLVDFLPKADGIIFVSDINQQITKSLTDFAKTISISNRPIYLVLTKSDTKTPEEIEDAKNYILKNSQVKFKKIISVSAQENNLDEFYSLLAEIDSDKFSILKKVNDYRVKNISCMLSKRIDELIENTKSDNSIDSSISAVKSDLEKLKRNIANLIDETKYDVEKISDSVANNFSESAYSRLESIVANNNANYDQEAISTLNILTSQYLNQYKTEIKEALYRKSNEFNNSDFELNLQSLQSIDFSELSLSNLSYNLNLNEVGHEYDKFISGGIKIAGAIAAVAAVVCTGGAAAPAVGAAGTGAAAGSVATTVATVAVNSADALIVAGTAKSMSRKKDEEIAVLKKQIGSQLENVEDSNRRFGQMVGESKGFVEGIVSKMTDGISKPKRQKIIHNYVFDTLEPEFKTQMKSLNTNMMALIQKSLNEEADMVINQKKELLNSLKQEKETSMEEYSKHIEMLKEYKKILESA